MTAKQTIYTKLTKLRQKSDRREQVKISASALLLWSEAGIHLLLAAVLAGAVIFDGRAPFAVALVGAAGSGLCGAGALVGGCFGYFATLELSAALRYTSCAILTFAVAFAFYDWKPLHRPWVMPLVAGSFGGFTGLILLSHDGRRGEEGVYLLLESVLMAACVWAFQRALAPAGRRERQPVSAARRGGMLVLACACLTALAPLEAGGVSLGRVLALAGVLLCAWQGGCAAGAVVGIGAGLAMDLSVPEITLYTMAYALTGLVTGLCRGRSRLVGGLAGGLAAGSAVLGALEQGLPLGALYEVVLACLLLLAVPGRAVRRLAVWLTPDQSSTADPRAQRLVQSRLEHTAQAFHTLYDALRSAFRPPENDNDTAAVYDRTASRVCRSCSLRDRCWKQDYNTTFNALNDATAAMVDRGRAESGDFPKYFADRCIHFPLFLRTVNEELTALFYRRQYAARVRENRAAVCRQYAQLSDLLGSAAAELGRELTPDPAGDRRLRQRLAELGVKSRGAVFRDGRGLVRVEAEGPDCGELARPSRVQDLSRALGIPLRVEEEGEHTLSLLQLEPLMALAGVAAKKKNGETVSGDAGTYFKRPDGKLYLLLCDGMGSGPEANRESSLAVRLLEQLLQAGVETRHALTTLASALALRGEETGGFTTVDLLQIDLFSGEGELFKLGAAPTYVKKGTSVQRLSGSSLPAGLSASGQEEPPLDHFSLRLAPGDCVLMISDGVCGGEEDGWLRERLAGFDGASPKDLARELVTSSPQQATDDRTALVVRVERREAQRDA